MQARTRQAIPTTERTRYEVALMRGSEIVYVLGYTSRKSKQGILSLCTVNLAPYFTADEWDETAAFQSTYSATHGLRVASNMFIRFTGDTERTAAL